MMEKTEFSRSLLFIDLESLVSSCMVGCGTVPLVEIYVPGSYQPAETDTLGAIVFGSFALQNRSFPHKKPSGTQGSKHKVPFRTSFILRHDIIFILLFV